MRKTAAALALAAALYSPAPAQAADVVLDWNTIAIGVPAGSPFNQARVVAATQLAVFEAVNAILGGYERYLDNPIVAPPGASVDAAVITAAHDVLAGLVPGSVGMLDARRDSALALIPDGSAKSAGISVGAAAAAAMLANRANDGSSPPASYLPESSEPYQWQLTGGGLPGGCPASGGVFANWPDVKTFGIADAAEFRAGPPPSLNSPQYARDFNEVKRLGRNTSTERSQERSDNVRFYAATSPAYIMNMAARQIAAAQGRSVAENARALALINMAISDAAVASFATKYHYKTWRPETAIHYADGDMTWVPLIPAPCFPSYASNHASLSSGGAEVLRRLYGEGEHTITITNPAFPSMTYHYTEFKQILNDISDARVLGGIHFRFDQDAGERLGRAVGTAVYKGNLRATTGGGSN